MKRFLLKVCLSACLVGLGSAYPRPRPHPRADGPPSGAGPLSIPGAAGKGMLVVYTLRRDHCLCLLDHKKPFVYAELTVHV
jgi:hypothetical protein